MGQAKPRQSRQLLRAVADGLRLESDVSGGEGLQLPQTGGKGGGNASASGQHHSCDDICGTTSNVAILPNCIVTLTAAT